MRRNFCLRKIIINFFNDFFHVVSYFVHYFYGWSDSSSSALNMKDSGCHKKFLRPKNNSSHSVFPFDIFWVQNSVHQSAIQTNVSLTFTLAYLFQRMLAKYINLGQIAFHILYNSLFAGYRSVRRYEVRVTENSLNKP